MQRSDQSQQPKEAKKPELADGRNEGDQVEPVATQVGASIE